MAAYDLRAFLDTLENPSYETGNPEAEFQHVESISISILDSEFGNYDPGVLERFLHLYLMLWRLEAGLTPFTDEPWDQ